VSIPTDFSGTELDDKTGKVANTTYASQRRYKALRRGVPASRVATCSGQTGGISVTADRRAACCRCAAVGNSLRQSKTAWPTDCSSKATLFDN
jgi:hypothetical protein